MKLTAKGRYAVTAMLDISIHQTGDPVSVLDIANRQSISPAYLEQIVGQLKRAGMLSSRKGPGGGYELGADAQDITISDIVAAVGEGVDVTRCGGRADCLEGHVCLTHNLWAELSDEIDGFLQSISLATLVARHQANPVTPEAAGDTDQRISATLI